MSLYPTLANGRAVNELISRGLAGMANGNGKYIAEKMLPANIDGLGGSFAEQASRAKTGTIQRLALYSMFGDAAASAAIDRGRGAKFHRGIGFGLDPLDFTARSFSGEALTAMEDLKDIQLGSSAEFDAKAVNIAAEMETLLLALEIHFATLMQTAANWANSDTPTTKWGAADDDPMADILAAVDAVENYGVDATDILIPRATALKLRRSSGLLEYLPTNMDRTALTNDRIANILTANIDGLQRVHFGRARYNSSNNPAIPVLTDVYNDNVWVGHLADAKGVAVGGDINNIKLAPTAAARVVVEDWVAEEYPENSTNSIVTQIRNRQWLGSVNNEIGYVIYDTTA